MKYFNFLFILLAFNFCFSQFTVSKNGVIYDGYGKHVKAQEFVSLLNDNPELLRVYQSGRSKKDFGNTFLIGGFIIGGGGIVLSLNRRIGEQPSFVMPVIGGGLFIFGGLLKIGFRKKIKFAVDEFNKLQTSGAQLEPELVFVCSGNSIGLKVNF